MASPLCDWAVFPVCNRGDISRLGYTTASQCAPAPNGGRVGARGAIITGKEEFYRAENSDYPYTIPQLRFLRLLKALIITDFPQRLAGGNVPGNTLMFVGDKGSLMDTLKTLYLTDRKDWRAWLENHFEKEPEIWLVYPKKSSGRSRIVYNDAVEEALCFGWIDSRVKTLDEESSAQRFSPRDPKSTFSQANKERLKWLLHRNMIHPSQLSAVLKTVQETFLFPMDIVTAIKNDRTAWKNYQNFSPSYQRIRVAYVDGARKRPAEFEKRLAYFIRKTRENKTIGFGGIEKYYRNREY